MDESELKRWLDCDDEMKMNSFIESIADEFVLRKFAILNAKSVVGQLVDFRSRNAVVVAEAFLNKEASEAELQSAYNDAETACEEIEAATYSDNDPSQEEEDIENASLVAMWVAYPVGHTGITSLDSAQQSALHTAYYCFKLRGPVDLKEQIERYKQAGLVSDV